MSTSTDTDTNTPTLPSNSAHTPSAETEKEYSIFRYLKEHTTLTITCVSATVAVTSFLFHYAIILHNITYLKYWNIDTIYMIKDHSIQIYTVFAAFVYCLILLGVHFLLSNTSDVYRLNNKSISAVKKFLKQHTTTIRQTKKNRKLSKKLLSKAAKNSSSYKVAQQRLAKLQRQIDNLVDDLTKNRSLLRAGVKVLRQHIAKHIIVTFAVAFVLCILGNLFLCINLQTPMTIKELLRLPLITILMDFIIYFIPAYLATSPRKVDVSDTTDFIQALNEDKAPRFPIEKISFQSFTTNFHNRTITLLILQYIISIFLCLTMFYIFGSSSAAQKTDFPILYENEQIYAIVYNNGQHVIMEPAVITDNTLNINTSIQRILSVDDIYYEIQTFDTVVLASDTEPSK